MKKEFKNVIIEICESLIECVKNDDFDGIGRMFQTLQGALGAVMSVHSLEQYIENNKKDSNYEQKEA